MTTDITVKILAFGLIFFFFLLVLVAMVLSEAKAQRDGEPARYLIPFAVVVLALCAVITFAAIAAQARKTIQFYRIGDAAELVSSRVS